jgi:acetyl esterase
MPLDPVLMRARERRIRAAVPPLYTLSLEQAREADLAAIRAESGPPEPVHEVSDREIHGPGSTLPVRVYRPSAEPGLPVLVYFFGGGWTLGSLDTGDGVCRALANAAGCAVVAVGYRLAPEATFPAAVLDCYAGVLWAARSAEALGVDAERMAVGGDSAGGNLAAAVTLLARQRGEVALAGQLLVYPNTDYAADTESLRDATDTAMFNQASVAWYWGHYLRHPDDGLNPLASPLRAEDHSGLPPALVITATRTGHYGRVRPATRRGRAVRAAPLRGRRAGPVVALRRHGSRLLHDDRSAPGGRPGHPGGRGIAADLVLARVGRPVVAAARAASGPGRLGGVPTQLETGLDAGLLHERTDPALQGT